MEFYATFSIFILNMTSQKNIVKSKRLKFVRALMYLDALFLVLSVALLDLRNLSFAANSDRYARILILIIIFGILYAAEKSLSCYLRKHRNDD